MENWEEATWALVAASVSAVATVLTALVAIWSLSESRKDSRERTRPIVTAWLTPGPTFVHGVLYLVIGNYGQTAARNLRVEFNPELPVEGAKADGRGTKAATSISTRYSELLEVLAPRQRLVNPVRHFVDGKNTYVDAFPEVLEVKLAYADGSRRLSWKMWRGFREDRVYEDVFTLRLNAHDWETRINPGNSMKWEKRMPDALETIGWELWEKSY
ncbi:hypothetical protein [Nesterenkonia rhizosphaerae]|uniref:Uncharacterized protein n=1 Tax=Nesterenkonia rhizosphaerae TaxID=1348272 RepID=A0ABP9G0A2_9MICC